jgi:hypothetical protein
MRRGADAVARNVCEAIVVDGSSLFQPDQKPKQVVCQPLLSATRLQVAHAVKGGDSIRWLWASQAEKTINAPVAGIAEARCSVLVRTNQDCCANLSIHP